MKRMKRSAAVLLAVCLCMALLPVQALAADEAAIIIEVKDTQETAEASASEVSAEDADGAQAAPAAEAGGNTMPLFFPEEEVIRADSSGENGLIGYLYGADLSNGLTEEINSGSYLSSSTAGAHLSGLTYRLYAAAKVMAASVAAGKQTSTVAALTAESAGLSGQYWTAAELGVEAVVADGVVTAEAVAALKQAVGYNSSAAIMAAWSDCPYEMYWHGLQAYGKFFGIGAARQNGEYALYVAGEAELRFAVSEDYAAETAFNVDEAKTKAVNAAINHAREIVGRYATKSDYNKLQGYMKELCALNTYNYDAAASATDAYGDPWQIIYMFDGNPDTNVVCEGYAKAFQYLCEKTAFNSPQINAYSVSGWCNGAHMWNIVHMDDGNNYLVDVTGCDQDWGIYEELFLTNAKGSVSGGYTAAGYTYSYDEETLGLFSTRELTLSGSPYGRTAEPDAPVISSAKNAVSGIKVTWGTVDGASGYYVYRSVDGSSYKKLATVSGTSYTDTAAGTGGAKYSYKVYAYVTADGATVKSAASAGKATYRVAQPVISSVKNGVKDITVSWGTVDGATDYSVYRSVNGGSYSKIATVTEGTSYTDTTATTGGAKYSYIIYARHKAGSYYYSSAASAAKSIYRVTWTAIKSAKNATSGITVSWYAVDGATEYGVYRSVDGGSYTRLAKVTGTSYTDKDTVNGTKYSYKLYAYCNSSYSPASAVKSVYRISKPTISAVTKVTSGVKVSWGAVDGATSYVVYRSVNGGSYSKLVSGLTGTSYTDKTATTKGTTYSYKVYAVCNGYWSVASAAKSITRS